jgi:uncharacterized protein YaiI (UPF0178 family)
MFELYVDADSCPKTLRTILLRRIMKEDVPAFFVSDRPLKDVLQARQEHTAMLRSEAKKQGISDPKELRAVRSRIEGIVVPPGPDSADNWIVEHAKAPSLAVTHDIPLAARLVENGISVIDDRGGIYDRENMAYRLSVRNMMTEFREMGVFAQKNRPMGPKEVKAFSDSFDSMFHVLAVKR